MRGKAGYTSVSAGSRLICRWVIWKGWMVILIQRWVLIHWPHPFSLLRPKEAISSSQNSSINSLAGVTGNGTIFKAKSTIVSLIKNQLKQDLENYFNTFISKYLTFARANLKSPLGTYEMRTCFICNNNLIIMAAN